MAAPSTAHGAVAVVGAGAKCPAGNDVAAIWDSLCAGRSYATAFEDERLPDGANTLVGRVTDFEPGDYLSPVEVRRLDRSHALAIAAAQDALDSCLGRLPTPDRRAVVCGVGLGAAAFYEEQVSRLLSGGVRALSPLTIPMVMPSSVTGHLSMRHDFAGPAMTVSAACASGAAAIGEGVELLRRGAADLVLAGGVDSLVNYGALCSFMRLDVMSRNVTSPELASRPFDVARDGFVMGEGAGFVVLVRASEAEALGHQPVGLVVGHASNADAYHLVAPRPDGDGALRCMRLALADAQVSVTDVTHVNAHGTSTKLNDLAEATALTALFESATPPVTAVKGSTGHMIGGSGAIEVIVALESVRHRIAPPVAGLCTLDPALDIDAVIGAPRPLRDGYGLSNSFGFGGANTSVVVAAF